MENKSKRNNYILSASILISALLVAGALIYATGAKKAGTGTQEANVKQSVQKSGLPQINGALTLGNPEAPVSIFIFSDFQCPACEYFYTEVEKPLKENYVKTGKVLLVYKDFPLEEIHSFARPAAEAARCAADQGEYPLYHDALFENQFQLDKIVFGDLAEALGLNKEQFNQCYNEGKYEKEVMADFNEGLTFGIDATPTIFINNQKFRGVYPYETLSQVIETILNK